MWHALAMVTPANSGGGKGGSSPLGFVVIGIVFILFGSLNLFKPDLAYRMRRWQYKNKEAWEPSNSALAVTRFFGGVAVIAGIVFLVIAATR